MDTNLVAGDRVDIYSRDEGDSLGRACCLEKHCPEIRGGLSDHESPYGTEVLC